MTHRLQPEPRADDPRDTARPSPGASGHLAVQLRGELGVCRVAWHAAAHRVDERLRAGDIDGALHGLADQRRLLRVLERRLRRAVAAAIVEASPGASA